MGRPAHQQQNQVFSGHFLFPTQFTSRIKSLRPTEKGVTWVQHEEVLEDPSSRVLNILVTRAPLPPLRPPGSRSDVGRSLSLAGICPERNLTSQEIPPRRPILSFLEKSTPKKEILRNLGPPRNLRFERA